jgi:flagellar P-ring protein precursor FlgI
MTTMITALLLLVAQAAPAPAAQQPGAQQPAGPQQPIGTTIYPAGVEAPAQPTGRSSSSVAVLPRAARSASGVARTHLLAPISTLMAVRGQEGNTISGIGLVTGLAGTGDSTEGTRQLLANLLLTRNINLDLGALSSKNIAIVQVEAELPAGVKPGRRIDVRVSTIGDSVSLLGGILTMTELTDITGTVVYATASGPISVGGFQVGGQGATAQRNHPTVGTMAGGGKVEREVPTSLVSEHGYIYLDLRPNQDVLANTVRVTEQINRLYPSAAEAQPDGKTVRVRVPQDLHQRDHASYLYSLLQLEVESEDMARVVINERTGVIVMGGDVRLRPGAVAHGNLTVTIAESPEASQPGPLSGGTTERLARTELNVEEQDGALILVPGAVTLKEVVDVLNVLGATPRDMVSILEAMSLGGLLMAEIRRL